VGSELFCGSLDTITQTLTVMGDNIAKWLDNALDANDVLGPDIPFQDPGFFTSVAGRIQAFVYNVLRLVQQLGKGFLDSLRILVRSLQAGIKCLLPCNPAAIIAISWIRAVCQLLRNMRVGTDAALWLTVDVRFEVDQIEVIAAYLCNYLCPVEIPSIGEAIDTFMTGGITEDQARCWVAMRGGDWEVWYPVVRARREKIQPREYIQWGRRNNVDDVSIAAGLRIYGYLDPSDAQRQVEMYDELPTIGDHLHWLTRNVFNADYVERYKLLDGFEERFWTAFGPDLRARGMKKQYAALHYAAHWIMPSPEQMKQFVYRLRPDRVAPGHEFTAADMDRILQEQDYNVLARQWFVDTVNPVPAISYIKRMFQLGAIDAVQLKAYHMDLGYTDKDSDNFVKVDIVDKSRHLATSGHGWTPQALASAYAIGQIQDAFVYDRMDEMGYPNHIAADLLARAKAEFDRLVLVRARSRALYQQATTVKSAITAGTMSVQDGTAALVSLGWPQEHSQSIAALADVAARANLSKAGVARIRSAYRNGEVEIGDALTRLLELGIVQPRAQQLITLWQIENTPNRKRRTAQQIVSDVSQGHVSVEEALARLTNLGYEDADRQLFMADIQGKVAKMAATRQAANIKAGKQQAAELAKLARQAQSTRSGALRRLKMLEPVTRLQKWLKLGIIDEVYFDKRMALYGYSPGEIQAYKTEILPKKG
jgi:hypothetical protein